MAAQTLYDSWQKAGVFLGGLGLVGVGAFFYVGPAEVGEEIPWHREGGAGFAVLGGVMMLAVLLGRRSSLGRRVHSLLFAMTAAVLLGLVGLGWGGPVADAWRLSEEGRPARATVVRIEFGRSTEGLESRARIRYDGHETTLETGHGGAGATFPVLYLPDDPKILVVGEEGDPFLTLARRAAGPVWFWGGAALALACAVAILVCLKGFLLGSAPDEAEG